MKRAHILLAGFFMALLLVFSQSDIQVHAHAPDMHSGSSGSKVSQLQSTLKKLGYFKVDVTGYYGPITEEAVTGFQRDFGVPDTGYTGPLTRHMLNQVDMMAHVVYGEARGEHYEGQVAVAAVILNRISSPDFPDTAYDVVFQRNAFTAVNDGQYWLTPDSTAYQAVKDAKLGWDPSYGATYYYNPSGVTDTWIFTRDVITQLGKHHFAK